MLPQVGTSPSVMIFDDMDKNRDKRQEWVSPSYSNEVFERAGVEKVFFQFLRDIFDLRKMLGFLPCASARDDRRVFCFSSDRPRRLRRHPITWRETGRNYCSFFGEIETDYCTGQLIQFDKFKLFGHQMIFIRTSTGLNGCLEA